MNYFQQKKWNLKSKNLVRAIYNLIQLARKPNKALFVTHLTLGRGPNLPRIRISQVLTFS